MDVSYSTYLLTYWGRDREEGALDVSWLIKRMTGDAAAHVTGSEHAVDRGLVGRIALGAALYIAAPVERDTKVGEHALVHGVYEAHGKRYQIGLELEL